MSYVSLEDKIVVCRKDHICIWCGEDIEKKEKARFLKGIYDGGFQNHHWHIECHEASQKDYDWYDETFPAYEFKRGTVEQR